MKFTRLYDQYDYEAEFNRILEEENEEALHIDAIMRGSRKSLPVTKTIKHGNQLDSEIYPAFFSIHDVPRGNQKKRSNEYQKKLNDRNAQKMIMRLININFTRNDLWICLEYDDDHLPSSEKEARADIRNYFRRLNYRRAKRGLPPLRYIYVTEYSDGDGNAVRPHHHVVMSGDMDRDEIEDLWTKCDRKYSRRLRPDDCGLDGMAVYITKTRRDDKGGCAKRWGASKGLKQPRSTRSYRRFSRKKIADMVRDRNRMKEYFEKAYPGYIFQSCEVRFNKVNGGVYLYAQLRRMPPPNDTRCRRGPQRKGSG